MFLAMRRIMINEEADDGDTHVLERLEIEKWTCRSDTSFEATPLREREREREELRPDSASRPYTRPLHQTVYTRCSRFDRIDLYIMHVLSPLSVV